MTLPSLPPQGDSDWYDWAQGVHTRAEDVAGKTTKAEVAADIGTAGTTIGDAARAASVTAAREAFGLTYHVAAPTGVAATDQAEVQTALDTASAAGGGVVQLQSGDYAMNTELILKDRVLLRGRGMVATQLVWSADLGAGKFAVRQDGSAAIQHEAPSVESLGIIGPVTSITLGVQSCDMDGWRIGRDVDGSQVRVKGFRAGGVIHGDHNTMTQCHFVNNYYNVLYGPNPLTLGNQVWVNCNFTGPAFAAIAVDGSNAIDATVFYGGHLSGPYGFYKFDGAATSTRVLLNNSLLDGLSFEWVGNAAILDESTGAAGGNSLSGVTIRNPGFSWNAGGRIAARPRDFAVHVRNIQSSFIRAGVAPFTSGDVATYGFTAAGSIMSLTIEQVGTPPTMSGGGNGVLYSNGVAQARYRKLLAAVVANDLCEASTEGVKPYGAETRDFAGVALAGGAVNTVVPIAYDGRVTVGAGTTGIATAGVPVKPAPGAGTKVAPASGVGSSGYSYGGAVTPDKHPIIGYSDRDISASGTGNIWLTSIRSDRTYITPGAVAALPTASAAYRGQMLRLEGAAGVADGLYVCMKDAANAYAWKSITLT